MIHASDDDLLDRYVAQRDPSAFHDLVQRHLNLVYSSALRRVRDPHLAQDIAQAVFLILSQKARSARRSPMLTAWLLSTVRYAAANALKVQHRRQRYESVAAQTAQASTDASANPSDILIWREAAAHLDDAILKLPALDRRVILLRYFQDQPIDSIARSLNTTEAAAKMRLSRSLEKLRLRLNRHGASLAPAGAASLTVLLAANAVRAAPAGLHSSMTTLAVTGSASTTATIIAKGALTMMTLAKAKTAAVVAIVACVVGTSAFVTMNGARAQNVPAPAADLRALADARVQAARKVIEMLDRQIQSGQPLTPSLVELKGTALRRLAEARIDASPDPAARLRAAEEYVQQSRDLHNLLDRRQNMDVSAIQLSHSAYHVVDAEYFLAKLKSAQ